MRRYVFLAVGGVLAAVLGLAYVRAVPDALRSQREARLHRVDAVCRDALQPAAGNDKVGRGQTAPDFTLRDWAGRPVTLSALKGRVLLLHFWASWCPTCTVEIPALERLHQEEAGRPFSLLAISVDDDWPEVRRVFAKGSPLTVLLDEGQQVAARFGVSKFPESLLIDRDGRILYYVVSDRDWASPKVRACIDAMLR